MVTDLMVMTLIFIIRIHVYSVKFKMGCKSVTLVTTMLAIMIVTVTTITLKT